MPYFGVAHPKCRHSIGPSKEFKTEHIFLYSVFKEMIPIPVYFTWIFGACIGSLLAHCGGRGWEAWKRYAAALGLEGP